MIVVFRIIVLYAHAYNAWIIFRVVDDWLGIFAAIVSVVLLPITVMVMPIVMLFITSNVAGPLSLWPVIVLIGILDWIAKKNNKSLLLR